MISPRLKVSRLTVLPLRPPSGPSTLWDTCLCSCHNARHSRSVWDMLYSRCNTTTSIYFFLIADIIEALDRKLDAEWRHFGTFLRVEYQIMKIIDRSNRGRPEDCMLELLDRWLSKEDGTGTLPRTWPTIVDAVKKSGYGAFAESLAQKYKWNCRADIVLWVTLLAYSVL